MALDFRLAELTPIPLKSGITCWIGRVHQGFSGATRHKPTSRGPAAIRVGAITPRASSGSGFAEGGRTTIGLINPGGRGVNLGFLIGKAAGAWSRQRPDHSLNRGLE